MWTRSLLILAAMFVLAGCGGVAPAPEFSASRECDRNGGHWHPKLNICEYGR